MSAEAIQRRHQTFDRAAQAESLRETIRTGRGQRKTRALKRLKVVNAFLTTDNSPEGMVLDAVPVIPPDLRPMVQLDGGRFATSDLNDLRSEEHTSELQSRGHLVCRLLLEKKKHSTR